MTSFRPSSCSRESWEFYPGLEFSFLQEWGPVRMQAKPSQGCRVVTRWSLGLASDPTSLLPVSVAQGESLHLSGSRFSHL